MVKTKNKKYYKKKSYKKRGGNIKQLAKETAVLLAKSVARLSLQSIKSGTKMSTSLGLSGLKIGELAAEKGGKISEISADAVLEHGIIASKRFLQGAEFTDKLTDYGLRIATEILSPLYLAASASISISNTFLANFKAITIQSSGDVKMSFDMLYSLPKTNVSFIANFKSRKRTIRNLILTNNATQKTNLQLMIKEYSSNTVHTTLAPLQLSLNSIECDINLKNNKKKFVSKNPNCRPELIEKLNELNFFFKQNISQMNIIFDQQKTLNFRYFSSINLKLNNFSIKDEEKEVNNIGTTQMIAINKLIDDHTQQLEIIYQKMDKLLNHFDNKTYNSIINDIYAIVDTIKASKGTEGNRPSEKEKSEKKEELNKNIQTSESETILSQKISNGITELIKDPNNNMKTQKNNKFPKLNGLRRTTTRLTSGLSSIGENVENVERPLIREEGNLSLNQSSADVGKSNLSLNQAAANIDKGNLSLHQAAANLDEGNLSLNQPAGAAEEKGNN